MPVRGREPRLLGAASNYLTAPKSRPGTGFSISAVEQPKRGAVAWKVGSAESLPVDQGSFDRAVLPLCCTSLQIPGLPSRRHSVRLPLMGVWSFGQSPRLMSPRACRIGSSP
jgi:hypothetical protein